MKHLLFAGLFLMPLFGSEAFLLPHRWQDARHVLGVMIRSDETPLTIVTGCLDDPYLRRTLRRALEKEKAVTLITPSQATASQWAMYRSLHACILPPDSNITFTVVRSSRRGCMLSHPLDTELLRNVPGLMLCDDGTVFGETLRLLRQECKPYFAP